MLWPVFHVVAGLPTVPPDSTEWSPAGGGVRRPAPNAAHVVAGLPTVPPDSTEWSPAGGGVRRPAPNVEADPRRTWRQPRAERGGSPSPPLRSISSLPVISAGVALTMKPILRDARILRPRSSNATCPRPGHPYNGVLLKRPCGQTCHEWPSHHHVSARRRLAGVPCFLPVPSGTRAGGRDARFVLLLLPLGAKRSATRRRGLQ